MSRNKEELQPAFLIGSREYRETSVIGNFFTFDNGIISLVVRGVRKPKSKIFLQPFTPLLLNFFGKGELKTCGKLECASAPIWLIGERLASGWYMNELLQRLLPTGVKLQNLFQQYAVSLDNLQDKSKTLVALREFELQLLKSIGISPHFQTNKSEEFCETSNYRFVEEEGFVKVEPRENYFVFSGKDLIAIKNRNWDKASLVACRKLTNFLISPLLGNKPLESRKLLIK